MKLSLILKDYQYEVLSGLDDLEILGVTNNSKEVKENYLFIAEVGYTVDGHNYINKAIENGAKAILVEREVDLQDGVTYIRVESTLDVMARASINFYENPSKDINMVGITGTNGKTSTTYFLKSILDRVERVGLIGTMGALIENRKIELNNTTPNSLKIQTILKEMKDDKIDTCLMEVSSHALDLKRVEYMDFNIGVFTNLSKDHLDHHGDMENYFNSKLKLFYKTTGCNIVNIDDPYGKRIVESVNRPVETIKFSIDEVSDIYATNIEYHLSKVAFTLNTPKGDTDILLNVPGKFSIYNALSASAVAYYMGIDLSVIKEGLESIKGVRGRFEVVETNTDYSVIIDFAHTADGLDKVLTVIDQFAKGRKIVVFGAGGNRDKTKRPEMGYTVGSHADISIVTSDNPRKEKPEDIIKDVVVGSERAGGEYITITDRKEAIHHALDIAEANDIILLAGKGHETYTIIGDEVFPFDEKQIVLDYLKEKQ